MSFSRFCIMFLVFVTLKAEAQEIKGAKEFPIEKGWAKNSVNAVIFRKNSVVTYKKTQYVAFYDPEGNVVLAKRKSGQADWEIKQSPFKGNAKDAHRSISIMVDGAGYLHMSWNHHNDSLNYTKSVAPGSLELGKKMSMTGQKEDKVTYPEFYKMPNGDLLFFYRYGASGNGDLVINRYSTATKKWEQLRENLIDGEGQRNAYWQACVDDQGVIHVSWVWRETWDVSTNHDICYARSKDGGRTWENSKGGKYKLPINVSTAEVAFVIPQKSELINQTSMTADSKGNPVIATYWREEGTDIPQFHVVYLNNGNWHANTVSARQQAFSLSGGGTKKIPISRPQILVGNYKQKQIALMVFRDMERGNRPSVAINEDFPNGNWDTKDLSSKDLGSWEPSYDTELWRNKRILDLFIQKVEQVDSEGMADVAPQMVEILEWDPRSAMSK